MAKFRKNEPIAAKRRVKVFIRDANGDPIAIGASFAALAAAVALTGTHHATLTWNATGLAGNAITISLLNDGTGTGSLTHTGGAYTFHYQSGVTTMANFVTAAAGVFTFSGHTPADVLTHAGDTQGPLALVGGSPYAWEVSQSSSTFVAAAGPVTNCTNASGVGIPGLFQYEFTIPELSFLGSEASLKFEYYNCQTHVMTCEMNDAADFDSIAENGKTYGDMDRKKTAALTGLVQNFGSGVLAFKSQDGAKTRFTGTTADVGRIAVTDGDLTP